MLLLVNWGPDWSCCTGGSEQVIGETLENMAQEEQLDRKVKKEDVMIVHDILTLLNVSL